MEKPSQIFNCDESGFADKTDTSKVIVASPTKFPYKKQGATGGRSYNFVLFCVSASGVILPPYIIYKAIKLYSNWCTKKEPPMEKIVLEVGQLLTAEQALKQLTENEQLKASIQSRKAKRTPTTSTPKRKVTRIDKKVAFKDDLLMDTHNSPATTGSSNTLPLSVFVSTISSSTAVHSTLTTDPVFCTSTSLLNMHQPSLVASQPSQISNDLWNKT
ncbi:unnamed protein product, partial [Didymodactylos carnosus]